MALINSEESAKRFQEKLNNGFYKRDRSRNTEIDYTKERQDRDTAAIEEFTKTTAFKELVNECIR